MSELDPLTLATRILNGENVPLEDLRKFIEKSELILKSERVERQREAPVSEKNIDFF